MNAIALQGHLTRTTIQKLGQISSFLRTKHTVRPKLKNIYLVQAF